MSYAEYTSYICIYVYTYTHMCFHKKSIYGILEFYKQKFKKFLNGILVVAEL